MYTITFRHADTGNWESSRIVNSIRVARKWSLWLAKQSYVSEVAIYRGQAGEQGVQ
jgi:hypothetical protein